MVAAVDQVPELAGHPHQDPRQAGQLVALRPLDVLPTSPAPDPSGRTGARAPPARRRAAFTPKRPWARTAVSVREPRSRQASIIGGSSESEVTAFAVAPDGPFGPIAVTTVTPVAYEPSARGIPRGSGRRRA